jgi:hypothetical protein
VNTQAASLDHLSRRVIRDVEVDLRDALRVGHLENEFVSALYLATRGVLERGGDSLDIALVDELALTLYLTASAWLGRDDSAIELLASLHRTLCKTLGVNDRQGDEVYARLAGTTGKESS